jgi:hypothetical protein
MGQSLLRVGDLVNRCLTYVPIARVALLAFLAAWMRLILGRWPVIYRDNPTGPVATVLSASTVYLLVVACFGLPLWAVTLACTGFLRGRRALTHRALVFGVAACVVVGIMWWDPRGFINWWLD